MFSPAAAAVRLLLLLAWTVAAVPPYALLLAFRAPAVPALARAYWRGVLRIANMRVVVHGVASEARPTLFVSNHASYLDIFVLGGVLKACFVAKKEVASWPGIGLIARLGRTVFVERRPVRSAEHRDEMRDRLRNGDSLILFPEGTSNDGNRVLPFKSALFSVAEGDLSGMPIQPISVAYTRLDGVPVGNAWRPFFAWYGDMTLVPHLWKVLGLGRKQVDVLFHPPFTMAEAGSRKAAAEAAWTAVARGVGAANSGRLAEAFPELLAPECGGAP